MAPTKILGLVQRHGTTLVGLNTVIICGGREGQRAGVVPLAMKKLLIEIELSGAQVDMFAVGSFTALTDREVFDWLVENEYSCCVWPARWVTGEVGGRPEGPIRNRTMHDKLKPILVAAFPGGSGTRDMQEVAKARGTPLWSYSLTRERWLMKK